MPAKAKYPSPIEQLRQLAEAARVEGKTFQEFWEAAVPPLVRVPLKSGGKIVGWKTDELGDPVEQPKTRLPRVDDDEVPPGSIRWPRDTFDRNCWHRAILSGAEDWRRSFEAIDASAADRSMSVLAEG